MTNTNNQHHRSFFSIPINSVLMFIFLCAACGVMVKECKRADLRLKKDQYEYQRFMDSVNVTKNATTIFALNNNQTIQK